MVVYNYGEDIKICCLAFISNVVLSNLGQRLTKTPKIWIWDIPYGEPKPYPMSRQGDGCIFFNYYCCVFLMFGLYSSLQLVGD